jgi:hypothetical protein
MSGTLVGYRKRVFPQRTGAESVVAKAEITFRNLTLRMAAAHGRPWHGLRGPEGASKKVCHSERSEESNRIDAAFSEVRMSKWILRCAQNDNQGAPFSTRPEGFVI